MIFNEYVNFKVRPMKEQNKNLEPKYRLRINLEKLKILLRSEVIFFNLLKTFRENCYLSFVVGKVANLLSRLIH